MTQRKFNYDAKVGDLIRFPSGKKSHRVVDIRENQITLAEPISDGGEGLWNVKADRLAEVGAFYAEGN